MSGRRDSWVASDLMTVRRLLRQGNRHPSVSCFGCYILVVLLYFVLVVSFRLANRAQLVGAVDVAAFGADWDRWRPGPRCAALRPRVIECPGGGSRRSLGRTRHEMVSELGGSQGLGGDELQIVAARNRVGWVCAALALGLLVSGCASQRGPQDTSNVSAMATTTAPERASANPTASTSPTATVPPDPAVHPAAPLPLLRWPADEKALEPIATSPPWSRLGSWDTARAYRPTSARAAQ